MSTTMAGCGGSTDDEGEGGPGATKSDMVCIGDSPSYTGGLEPAVAFDYLAMYRHREFEEPALVMVEDSGTACGGASDLEACQAALAAAAPDRGFFTGRLIPEYHYFLYTVGDEVGAVTSTEDLKVLLGSIDTANEAALVLWASSRRVECESIFEEEGRYYAEGTWTVSDCPITSQELRMEVDANATVSSTPIGKPNETGGCAGRRPEGLRATNGNSASSCVGSYFAKICHLEGAAVVAFAVLEEELRAHGAPHDLIERARRAQADEMRHTRAMAGLAQRFGASPPPVVVEPRRERSLFDIALENAVEGCIRETYGAVVAHWQARTAADAEVRSAWGTIAREETEHAELSRAIDEWILPKLSEHERRQIAEARRNAIDELRREVTDEPAPELIEAAGLPAASEAEALLAGLEREVWAA